MSDFAGRVAGLKAELGSDRWRAVSQLRSVEEAWARALLGLDQTGDLAARVRTVAFAVDPQARAEAIEHLAAAESWQWEIGTWSSGSGEGLASMFEVRGLQLAQAWLQAAAGAPDEALRLAAEVHGDANRIASRYDADVAALRALLTPEGPANP